MKIIIVDDNIDVTVIFKELLKIMGHEVIAIAYNGEEAIQFIKENNPKFDIVLMDNRIPKIDGLTATKEILKLIPDSKIIFLSADYSIKNEALKIGALDFLEKPIDYKELSNCLSKYSK